MVDNVIYQFWLGSSYPTENRKSGLITSLLNLNSKICLVTDQNLSQFVLKDHPLHPAYKYLSNNHKSDYLRCYFMNFHGGGYADIKQYSHENTWKQCFDLINADENIWIIGEKEIQGGSPIWKFNTPEYLSKVLVNGWFICRAQTDFTKEWYSRVMKTLDFRYEALKAHPSTDPFGGVNYPLRWAEVQGEIFHQVIVDMYNPKRINNCLISGKLNLPYR